MRKSNSRDARRAVEAYVLDYVSDINERMEQPDSPRPVSSAFETLKDEMSYQSDYDGNRAIMGEGLAAKYHKAGRYGFVSATSPYWVYWLACKAGEFAVSYYDQRAAVASWLDQTPEEADRYSNEEAARMYCHMSAQAFERLYNRENEPHRVNTADFIRLYQAKNKGHFFDRETLKHWGQTRKSFTVEGFYLVTDSRDNVQHDCYAVFHTLTAPTGEKFPRVAYFDRVTLEEIYTAQA